MGPARTLCAAYLSAGFLAAAAASGQHPLLQSLITMNEQIPAPSRVLDRVCSRVGDSVFFLLHRPAQIKTANSAVSQKL